VATFGVPPVGERPVVLARRVGAFRRRHPVRAVLALYWPASALALLIVVVADGPSAATLAATARDGAGGLLVAAAVVLASPLLVPLWLVGLLAPAPVPAALGGLVLVGCGALLAAVPRYRALRRRRPRLAAALAYWATSVLALLLYVASPTLFGPPNPELADLLGRPVAATAAGGLLGVGAGLLVVVAAVAVVAVVLGPVALPLLVLLRVVYSPLGVALAVVVLVVPVVVAAVVLVRVVAALNGGRVPGSLLHLWLIDAVATRLWHAFVPTGVERRMADHARAQGRVGERDALRTLALPAAPTREGWSVEPGIPLGYLSGRPIGLGADADLGHVAVVGPTRSGKSFHLTDALLRWPGPAVVVDPKGEQWERTAGLRARTYGPVHRIPPQGLDLGRFYDLAQDLDLRALHEALLQPWRDGRDRIFADKALPLFTAAAAVGKATGEHPLRVPARWAQGAPTAALGEARTRAPAAVDVFTDGYELEKLGQNRFALSAWGTFSTRFGPFAAHIGTVAADAIAADWLERNATIYVTYPLQTQAAVAPLAAALVGGLIRHVTACKTERRVLFALDEMPTVALPHLASDLATVGGAGITALLYAQSLPHVDAVYGRDESLAILSNCTHQVFFSPRDPQTGRLLSDLFGSMLEVAETQGPMGSSYGTRYRPALEVGAALALPMGSVAVFSQGLRLVADDSRSAMGGWLDKLPPAPVVDAPDAEQTTVAPDPSAGGRTRYW